MPSTSSNIEDMACCGKRKNKFLSNLILFWKLFLIFFVFTIVLKLTGCI